jgi:hypothetical protein
MGPPATPLPGAEGPLLRPDASPALRLLTEALPYTDAELITALRSRLAELDIRAGELEQRVAASQARLVQLVTRVRERSLEAEGALVEALVPWAREEATAIVKDAQRRAAELGPTSGTASDLDRRGLTPAELGLTSDAGVELGAIGELVISHFQLQESLVRLIANMALDPSD